MYSQLTLSVKVAGNMVSEATKTAVLTVCLFKLEGSFLLFGGKKKAILFEVLIISQISSGKR